MKCLVFLLMCASLMMLLSAPAYGASEIVLDEVTGLLAGDTVLAGHSVKFTFRLTFTGLGGNIKVFTNGFRVWTHQNGNYTDNFTAITYDTFSHAWTFYYSLCFGISPVNIDGLGADTIGFDGAALNYGFQDPFDEQVWWIETVPSVDGDTLCIDSSWWPPAAEWRWMVTSVGDIYPDWSGPHCFHVWDCCVGIRGNVDRVAGVNIADLVYLVEYLFCSGPALPCEEVGDVNGDGGTSGAINVADVTYLVEFLFFDGPAPPPCP